MTEAAAAPPRRRGRWLKLALIVSLTLNLCFVAGLVYTKLATEAWLTPQQRVESLARDLNLTDPQRQSLRELTQVLRTKGQALRATNEGLINQVWAELDKPQPDQDAIGRVLGQIAENRRQFQLQVGMALGTFFAKLSPEQRAHFIDLARQRRSMIATRILRLLAL